VLLNRIAELDKFIDSKNNSSSLGFVPTMGALHQGHLSLMEKALELSDVVVVSIFVNPTQFNNADDLTNYPRTIESDLEAIHSISKDILVYVPDVKEIYPNGIESEHYDFGTVSRFMEGKYRQGHFNGVGTVLQRFFELIKPDKAFFGEKDYQQLAVVKRLVKITGQNVSVIGCQTYRETNGLAKSSRNKLLSPEEKDQAGIIYDNLMYIKRNYKEKSIAELKEKIERNFENLENFKLEYCEVADEENLVPTDKIESEKKYRAFIAAYCNKVRLIDNMPLN
jgi:pantoate--beta-alanine ligase